MTAASPLWLAGTSPAERTTPCLPGILGPGTRQRMGSTLRSLAARYGTALLAVAVALLVRLVLDPLVGDGLPFLAFCLAVVAVAWHGGFGPSFLALVLGLLAAAYF